MQGTCDQCTESTGCGNPIEVFDRAHSSRCVNTAPRHALGEFDDQCEVRALGPSNPLEIHSQYVLRPISLRMIEQWLWADESFAVELQRKDHPRSLANIASPQHELCLLEGLAADD